MLLKFRKIKVYLNKLFLTLKNTAYTLKTNLKKYEQKYEKISKS